MSSKTPLTTLYLRNIASIKTESLRVHIVCNHEIQCCHVSLVDLVGEQHAKVQQDLNNHRGRGARVRVLLGSVNSNLLNLECLGSLFSPTPESRT